MMIISHKLTRIAPPTRWDLTRAGKRGLGTVGAFVAALAAGAAALGGISYIIYNQEIDCHQLIFLQS
jgi:hypothetical protein